MIKSFFCAGLMAGLGISQLYGQVTPPKSILPIPQEKQVKWQQMETYAFVHFGLNTFNDKEWGFGDTPASIFNPSHLDCEQWVKTFVNSGMKGVILTAKHHDGFCLWPTKLTEYCVRNSPYKDGKGDVVLELAKACKKYGLKFAVYLSPWDRNATNYGKKEYIDYFYKQLNELLTQYGPVFEVWFDGANGGDGWYGGANEVRRINPRTYYEFERAYKMVDSIQSQAVIFSDTGPGCRWVGNEKGFAGETNWSLLEKGKFLEGDGKRKILNQGLEDGTQWTAAECDVSIRNGWFYHPEEDKTVKTSEQLLDLYYKSVGRNSTLLLNFPVDRKGLIPSKDSLNAVTFHQYVLQDFANNLIKKASIHATNTRHRNFSTSYLIDEKYDTYWAGADGTNSTVITIKWHTPMSFNRLSLQEYIPLGQRVKSFHLEYLKDGKWTKVPVTERTTTIGFKRLIRFPMLKTRAFRVCITDAKGPICISEMGIYKAEDREFVTQLEKIPTLTYELNNNLENKSNLLFDYNANTICSEKGRKMIFKLSKPTTISKFYYVPFRSSTQGLIHAYELWAGMDLNQMKKVGSGEFSNIENNPVMQTVKFEPIKAKYVELRAIRLINNDENIVNASEIYIH